MIVMCNVCKNMLFIDKTVPPHLILVTFAYTDLVCFEPKKYSQINKVFDPFEAGS